MRKKTTPHLVSIVIPLHNEAQNLPLLHAELTKVLTSLPYKFEFLLVDDGSTDSTYSIIEQLHQKDRRIKGISFSRNFGHQAALTAGFQFARGDGVITMDGDLQHPPDLIPTLLKHWERGAQVVNTIREKTEGEPMMKRITSRLFYRILNSSSKTKVHPFAADFRLLDRKVVESLNTIKERDRFLRGLISWVGYTSVGVPYKAQLRAGGRSKYTFGRMLHLAVDGITSFSATPLHLVTYFGLVVSCLSFLSGAYSIYAHFFTSLTIPGWTTLVVTVSFLGGLQLISIGVLGEYLIRVYNETKGRPLYIVKESLGFETGKKSRP